MQNPKQEFPINIGGQERKLKFTYGAIIELEDAIGQSIMALDSKKIGVKFITHAIRCGLLHKYPDVKLTDVLDWMDDDSDRLAEWSGVVAKALAETMSPKGSKDPRPTQENDQQKSTGEASSA